MNREVSYPLTLDQFVEFQSAGERCAFDLNKMKLLEVTVSVANESYEAGRSGKPLAYTASALAQYLRANGKEDLMKDPEQMGYLFGFVLYWAQDAYDAGREEVQRVE